MPPFKEWKYKEASEAITAAIKVGAGELGFKKNAAFVEDKDHWQNGDDWPGPDGGQNSPLRTTILQAVSRQFTPVDVIGEVLDNVANALLSTEADVSFTPLQPVENPESEDAKKLAKDGDRMRSLVSHWWDKQKLWEKARVATKRARWSSRGALRTWIAPSTLQAPTEKGGKSNLPTNFTFEAALEKVLLSAPRPDKCYVITDSETNEKAAIRIFERDKKNYAEIWFVDGDKTTVRIIAENSDSAETFDVNLGKRLPIAEMEADVLITEPVRRQQNRLNFFETLLVRVAETAGFPERYTTNAKPQGVWLTTAPTNAPALETHTDGAGKTWYLHATPRTLGAAITTDLRGIPIGKAADGLTDQIATPGVTFKEPTDPEYAIKASKHAKKTILQNCKQGHLSVDSTAESSGLAYVQARAAFEKDLTNTKGPLEGMLREIIESAIAWAELMSSTATLTEGEQRDFLKRFRCVVNLKVNAGPITKEEKDSNAAMAEKGLLSRASAMAQNGVEDVAAEMTAIDDQPETKRANAKDLGDTIKSLKDAGAGTAEAAEMAGLTPEDAKKFGSSQFTEPPVTQ